MSTNDKLGVSLREVCGPLVDFLGKLVSPNGRTWLAGFKKFLRGENPHDPSSTHSEIGILARVKNDTGAQNLSEEEKRALIPECYRRLVAFFDTVAWENTALLLSEFNEQLFVCRDKSHHKAYGLNCVGIARGDRFLYPHSLKAGYTWSREASIDKVDILALASSWVHYHGDLDVVEFIKTSVSQKYRVEHLGIPLVPIAIPE